MAGDKAKLTAKQKAFVDEYLIDLNATQAAIRAGYSRRGADVQGLRLLANASVKIALAERMQEKESDRVAKQDEVLEFLTAVMRGEIKEEFALGVGMGEQVIRTKQSDSKTRMKAAELLAKRYGLLNENVNITGALGVQIVDDIE